MSRADAGHAQRLHCVVEGRVQGVGFRVFVQRKAQRLGLGGWVRNREDGCSVEALAEGAPDQLQQFREALASGPRGAHVNRISCEWAEAIQGFQAFEIKR